MFATPGAAAPARCRAAGCGTRRSLSVRAAKAAPPSEAAPAAAVSPWAVVSPAVAPPPPSQAPAPGPAPPAGPPPASLYPSPPQYASAPFPGYGYYSPPPPPPPPSSSLPPWLWVGVGVALAGLGSRLLDAAKAKQADVQQAMMQQMLKSMMGSAQAGGAAMPPPFPGFAGFPGPQPPQPPRPAPAQAAPQPAKGATVDVTATAVPPKPESAPAPAATAAAAPAPKADAPPPPPPPKASYFRDAEVVDNAASRGAHAGGGAGGSAQTGAGAGGGEAPAAPGMSVDALENMMRDPSMQKLIYPYLPEGMRNPQTFEWMLKNPATRQQLETLLKQNGGFAGMAGGPMADAMKNFDMNAPEVKQQFEAMGMKPEEVVQKIMATPDLAAAFQNPRVQAAIMDCSANPMNIAKYQDDAEIMDVFMKISGLFPNASGMPPGVGR